MLPDKYQKRSFLRFDCGIDLPRLIDEFHSIETTLWESSYWGSVHCSIGMLLLRGGDRGDENDFFSEEVSDKRVLSALPYIEHLIGEDGPFGKAHYAFIFKLKPNGVTIKHQDSIERWFDMYRIHVPIITNPGAHLIVNDRSQHLATGFAWSFDNQSDHGVVNGEQERVHLIFDVPFTDKLASQLDTSDCLEGSTNQDHINRISQQNKAIPSYPGDEVIKNGIKTMRAQGANSAQIAGFMNSKSIPSKVYPVTPWTEEMVDSFS